MELTNNHKETHTMGDLVQRQAAFVTLLGKLTEVTINLEAAKSLATIGTMSDTVSELLLDDVARRSREAISAAFQTYRADTRGIGLPATSDSLDTVLTRMEDGGSS